MRKVADFVSSDDDILVVNGYAGTGKTTAMASVITTLKEFQTKCVLLAPTGRAAKVLASYAGQQAFTIHKHIYRQKSVGGDGFGQFTLSPNKDKETLFIVDEVSLIGIDAGQQQSTSVFGSGNLLEDLVSFVRSGVECKVILIGDSAQLPPVGLDASPALLRDYMAMMGGVSFVELTTVVRQQNESGILHNATNLRHHIADLDCGPGVMDICDLRLETDCFEDVERVTGGELIEKISDAYATYGEDEVIILCRSNKRAIKYNLGVRSTVQFKEERLVRDDKLMIVKNCYQFVEDVKGMDYIANGDIARLEKISKYEERYGLHFAEARISFPDYDDQEIVAKVILDTLESESASLTYEQSNMLYQGVNEDYSHISTKKKRYEAVR
jgi:exodeoxyribonuclease-5